MHALLYWAMMAKFRQKYLIPSTPNQDNGNQYSACRLDAHGHENYIYEVHVPRLKKIKNGIFNLHFQKRYLDLKLCTLIKRNNIYILIYL
jgi:hypothetical protein